MAKLSDQSLKDALKELDTELIDNHINTYSAALNDFFYQKTEVEQIEKRVSDNGADKLVEALSSDGDLSTDDPSSLSILPAAFSMGHAVVTNAIKKATENISLQMSSLTDTIKNNMSAVKASTENNNVDKGSGIGKLAMSAISKGLGIGFINLESIAKIKEFIDEASKVMDQASEVFSAEKVFKYKEDFERFRLEILDKEQGSFIQLANGFIDIGKFFTENKEDLDKSRKAIRNSIVSVALVGVLAFESLIVGAVGSIAFPLLTFTLRFVESSLKALAKIGKLNAIEILKSAIPIAAAVPSIALLSLMLFGIVKALSGVPNPIETVVAFTLFTITTFGIMLALAALGTIAIYATPLILLGTIGIIAMIPGIAALGLAALAMSKINVTKEMTIKALSIAAVASSLVIIGLSFIALAVIAIPLVAAVWLARIGMNAIVKGLSGMEETVKAITEIDLGTMLMAALIAPLVVIVTVALAAIGASFVALAAIGLVMWIMTPLAIRGMKSIVKGIGAMNEVAASFLDIDLGTMLMAALIAPLVAVVAVEMMILGDVFTALGAMGIVVMPLVGIASSLLIAIAGGIQAMLFTLTAIKSLESVMLTEEDIENVIKAFSSMVAISASLAVLGYIGYYIMPLATVGVLAYSLSFFVMSKSLISTMNEVRLLSDNIVDQSKMENLEMFFKQLDSLTAAISKISIVQVITATANAWLLKPLAVNLGKISASLKTLQDIEPTKITNVVNTMAEITGVTANLEVSNIYNQAKAYNILAKSLGNIAKQGPKLASVAQALSMIAKETMKDRVAVDVSSNIKSTSDKDLLSKTTSLEVSTLKKDNIDKSSGEAIGPEYTLELRQIKALLESISGSLSIIESKKTPQFSLD